MLEQLKGTPDAFERFGLPGIAAVGLPVGCLHRSRHVVPLPLGMLAAGLAILLGRVESALREERPGVEPFLNAYEPIGWFPLVYPFSFAGSRRVTRRPSRSA